MAAASLKAELAKSFGFGPDLTAEDCKSEIALQVFWTVTRSARTFGQSTWSLEIENICLSAVLVFFLLFALCFLLWASAGCPHQSVHSAQSSRSGSRRDPRLASPLLLHVAAETQLALSQGQGSLPGLCLHSHSLKAESYEDAILLQAMAGL